MKSIKKILFVLAALPFLHGYPSCSSKAHAAAARELQASRLYFTGIASCANPSSGKFCAFIDSDTSVFAYQDSAGNQRNACMDFGNQTISGNKTFAGTMNFSALTASTPLKLDGSKNVVSADVDLTTDVTGALPFANLASLTSAHILVGSAGNVATDTAVTGDVTITNAGVTAIGANKVLDTMIRQSSGLSLVGRSANSSGDVADITAASDGQAMRRSGAAIGFGAIDLASANAVTGVLPVANATIATQALTTCTTARTVDWATGNAFTLTLTSGNACTLTFSNPTSGQTITLWLTNGSGGGTATVVWPTAKWFPAGAPVMTTGTAALDVCTCTYNGTDYACNCLQNGG